MTLPDRIATLALSTFDKLPKGCKPRIHNDGRREWTPMCAIILVTHDATGEVEQLECVSLATGTKCLPASQVKKCDGLILHDCHAEILALRGLNRWLLQEMKLLLNEESHFISSFLELNPQATTSENTSIDISTKPFRFRSHTSIYMFTTTAPCGDASMDLLISASADSTPWTVDLPAGELPNTQPLGRGYYSILGAVRRKPARADAESTMSKSCSDKIALKQFTGLLAFPVDVLLQNDRPAFLKGLVVYADEFDAVGYERAWGPSGRLSGVDSSTALFFDVHVLPDETPRFTFERKAEQRYKVTNISTVFVAGPEGVAAVREVLVNGVKQGYRQFEDRPGKGSVLCRRKMVEAAMEVGAKIAARGGRVVGFEHATRKMYSEVKLLETRRHRCELKDDVVGKMGGWVSNSAEDDFEVLVSG